MRSRVWIAVGLLIAVVGAAPQRGAPPARAGSAGAQPSNGGGERALSEQLASHCRDAGGTIGVAVVHVETGRTAGVQEERPFPLFSVFKLPLAVAVLQDVQARRLSLDRKVRVTPSAVVPGWQGNTELWSKPVDKTVRELLELSIVRSDNTASDQLLKLVGGPAAVTRRMRALGLEHLQIRFATREIAGGKGNNTGSPADIARLLVKLQTGKALQPPQQELLLQLMTRATTGLRRLRGKLPPDTPVADKTGTGAAAVATHDVGLITLPGGRGHLAMAVLVTGSPLTTEQQEDRIAELARVAFDDYVAALPSATATPAASDRAARPVHHFVFFGREREKLAGATSFLESAVLEGAQVTYTWRELEPQKDAYDFRALREDLAFLGSRRKKLFVQLQDLSFSPTWTNVPEYLRRESSYHGGTAPQYRDGEEDPARAVVEGWAARRWDPAVQERLHKLLNALGKEFDGRIAGINFTETAVSFGESGKLFPAGFSPEIYRDAIITNMKALKVAFPRSVTLQYANFMPGEWRPTADKGYLRAVYQAARELKVGVGGPDLLPYRPGQLKGPYPLIREVAGTVPIGIAIQDGNYDDKDPKTGKRITVPELVKFATEELKVDYLFWCTQEPFYSQELIPYLWKEG